MNERELARDALTAIPPDLSRDHWVRIAMAAQHGGLDEEDFHSWSMGGDSYNRSHAHSVWSSAKPDGGVTVATLFAMAKDHGWKRPTNGHAAPPARPQAPRKPKAEATTASALFARFLPAPADHPYILKKRGIPDGLRVVPAGDPLRVAGKSVAGWLAVPAMDGQTLCTVQFISPTGEKLSLGGHSFGSGMFAVGEIKPGRPVYACEGIGQAWSAWKATGDAGVVCFGSGRMRTVAKTLKDAGAQLVLVADAGMEAKVEAIAAEVSAQWVRVPEGWPVNSDINDLGIRDGFDAVEALLTRRVVTVTTPEAPMPRALDFVKLSRAHPPPRTWFVREWLGAGPSYLAGPGGCGKSSVVQHQATCGAIGRAYIGQQEAPFRSLVWNCEDDHDELWRRQEQICGHEQIEMASLHDRLHIVSRYGCENALMVESQGALSHTSLMKELREQVNDLGIDVLWLDNAAHLFLGNHDDRTHVTSFINALNGLVVGRPFAAVIVAHPGKALGSEYSGSVAWENAVRMRWYMGNRLPDERPEADTEVDRTNVRFLAKRKANYTAADYVRFTVRSGLFVPDTAVQDGVISGMLKAHDEKRAEQTCIDGYHALRAMGLLPSDGKTASDYLPRALVEKKLNAGYGKAELAKAMNRLMADGKLVRAEVGKYSGRAPRMGLLLVEKAP